MSSASARDSTLGFRELISVYFWTPILVAVSLFFDPRSLSLSFFLSLSLSLSLYLFESWSLSLLDLVLSRSISVPYSVVNNGFNPGSP